MLQFTWLLLIAVLFDSICARVPVRFAPPGQARDDEEGCYIFKFKSTATNAAKAQLLGKHPHKKGKNLGKLPVVTLCGLSDDERDALLDNDDLESVEQDSKVTSSGTAGNWGLDRIDQTLPVLDGQYSPYGTGDGVKVYILDTGIDYTHEMVSGRSSAFYDAVTSSGDAADCNGHGTYVAGVVGSQTYGVATEVQLLSVRVLDCNGSGVVSQVLDGLNAVLAGDTSTRTSVINLSFGGSLSTALNDAVQNANDQGFVVVAAAGNEGADASSYSPASASAAITVAATDSTDARASFSNYGSVVSMFAPGDNIVLSTWPEDTSNQGSTTTVSGTSFAAPFVSGAAALFLGENTTATPADVRSYLLSTALLNAVSDAKGTPNRLLNIQRIENGSTPVLNYCQSQTAEYLSYQSWESGPSPKCTMQEALENYLPKNCAIADTTCNVIVCDGPIAAEELDALKTYCPA